MYTNTDIESDEYITRIIEDGKQDIFINFHIRNSAYTDDKTVLVEWWPTLCSQKVYNAIKKVYDENEIKSVTSLKNISTNQQKYLDKDLVVIVWKDSIINNDEIEDDGDIFYTIFDSRYKSQILKDLKTEIQLNIFGYFKDNGITRKEAEKFVKTWKKEIDALTEKIYDDSRGNYHELLTREGDLVREYIFDGSLPLPDFDEDSE